MGPIAANVIGGNPERDLMRWLRTRGRPEITSPVTETEENQGAPCSLCGSRSIAGWSRASDDTASALVSNNAMVSHQINVRAGMRSALEVVARLSSRWSF